MNLLKSKLILIFCSICFCVNINAQAAFQLKNKKEVWRNDSLICELKVETTKDKKMTTTSILNNIGRTMIVVTPMPSEKKCERLDVLFLSNGKTASFPFIGFADKKAIAAMVMNNGLICPAGYDFTKVNSFLKSYPKRNTDSVSVQLPKNKQ